MYGTDDVIDVLQQHRLHVIGLYVLAIVGGLCCLCGIYVNMTVNYGGHGPHKYVLLNNQVSFLMVSACIDTQFALMTPHMRQHLECVSTGNAPTKKTSEII